MKKTITLFVAGLFAMTSFTTLNAQDCQTKLSLFAENVKAKNYKDAAPQLAELRKDCPTINSAIYAYGERIYKDNINKATSEAAKKAEAQQRTNLITDNFIPMNTGNDRGDFDINTGIFRPDQYVPTQFQAQMKRGGEIGMVDDATLKALIAAGADIELLD